MLLVLLERPEWIGFNEGDLKILKSKVWEILNFEFFWSLKIQLYYKKWFWKEKLVR
jgi:hypothetical protein